MRFKIRDSAVFFFRLMLVMYFCVHLLSKALAADSFQVVINVAGFSSVNVITTDGQTAIDYFKEKEIAKAVPGYTGNEAVAVLVKYSGVSVEYQFLNANSNVLTIRIPELGIVNKTFNGATRSDSRQLALNYLKANGYLSQLMKSLTAKSVVNNPANPIAGNPQGLLASLVQNDYDQQFLLRTGKEDVANEAGVGVRYGIPSGSDGVKSQSLVPYYRHHFESLRGELSVSLPITLTEAKDYQAFQAITAISYRIPILSNWYVGAGASYAVMGVTNWLGLVSYGGVSVTSDFRWNVDDWKFSVGNMVGYYRTFELANYEAGLRNVAYRNGLVMSHPINLLGKDMDVDYFAIDTRYSGGQLNEPSQQELGLALRKSNAKSGWRVSASFIPSSVSSGFISCNYSF